MAGQVLSCKTCGEEYLYTEGERKFYEKNSLKPPTHCFKCRKLRKNEKRNEQFNFHKKGLKDHV
jgi:hypothetical protein